MVLSEPLTNLWRRSACDSCRQPLAWFQLIPVLSSWFLRPRCRSCNHQPSLIYGLIEAVIGLMFAITATVWSLGWSLILIDIFILISLHISLWDWRCRQIPVIDLGLLTFLTGLYTIAEGHFPVSSLVMLGLLVALYTVWGLRRKPFPLTSGDWVLLIIAGGWLGPESLPLFLAMAGGLGIFTAVIYKRHYQTPCFPFAPAILMATWICLVVVGAG